MVAVDDAGISETPLVIVVETVDVGGRVTVEVETD